MAEIQLTRGLTTLVDDEMFEYLNQWKWYAGQNGYAQRTIGSICGRQMLRLHRIVLERTLNRPLSVRPREIADHINRNKLDNRSCNLRIATSRQNNYNKESYSGSGWKGVCFIKPIANADPMTKPWKAQIKAPGKRTRHIGYYRSAREAAYAYNEAAIEHFGEHAYLNQVFSPGVENG